MCHKKEKGRTSRPSPQDIPLAALVVLVLVLSVLIVLVLIVLVLIVLVLVLVLVILVLVLVLVVLILVLVLHHINLLFIVSHTGTGVVCEKACGIIHSKRKRSLMPCMSCVSV